MKVNSLLTESYECVKIGGILRNLSNDEMKIYKKVKSEGRVFKMDLPEYDANVATTMVSKGLLRRKKAQQDEGHGRIYYTTIGRKGHIKNKEIDEVAPPGRESEKWIKKNKKRFKDKYGKDYEKYLYGKAWNNYNGKKKVNESVLYENENEVSENDLPYIKTFLECYFKLKNTDMNRSSQIDGPAIDLFDSAQELLDHLPRTGLNNCWDKIQDGISDAWTSMRDTTAENCDEDYSVYTPGQYNAEETHRKIDNDYGIMEVMRDYATTNKIKTWVAELFNSIKEKLRLYNNETKEPDFDGNFDNVEIATPNTDTDNNKVYTDTVQATNKLLAKIKLANENSRGDSIMRDIIDVHDGFFRDIPFEASVDIDTDFWNEIDESFIQFTDKGYEYVDDYLNDEDYDFIVRGEPEYDTEATWDNICEASYEDLFRRYGGSWEAEKLLEELLDPYEYLKLKFGKQLNIENVIKTEADDDDSGSEFDE